METEARRCRKRKDYPHLSASSSVATRSSRLRMSLTGGTSDGCRAVHSSSVGQFNRSTGDGLDVDSEVSYVGKPTSAAAVKDLRVHRVFSPASIGSLDLMEMDVADRKKDYSTLKDCAVNEDVDNCVVGEGETEAGLDCGRSMDDACDGDGGMNFESNVIYSGQNGASKVGQDCVHTTPPDAVLGETEKTELASDQQTVDQQGLNKTSNSPIEGSHPQLSGRHSQCSRNLKSCLRPKLFGNPTSFNYRRLLPCLMNLTKGALKILDKSPGVKPALQKNAESSAVMSSLSALEPHPIRGTESSYQCQAVIPSRTSEPNVSICIENTACIEVPFNSNQMDSEETISVSPCNLNYGLAKSSTSTNHDLSQSGTGNVTLVLGGLASGIDGKDANTMVYSEAMNGSKSVNSPNSPSQQSPSECGSELMDVPCVAVSGKCLGVGDVHAAENCGANYETAQSNICGQNTAKHVQERPPSNVAHERKDAIGMVRSIMKPQDQIDDSITNSIKKLVHEQLVVSDANTFSNEAMSCSNCIDSPAQKLFGENRSVLIDVLGDDLSCKRLGSGDGYTAKKNGTCYYRPQIETDALNTADFVQDKPLCNKKYGGKDVTGKVKPISKSENQIGDGSITNTKNSVCEQLVASADRKLFSSSERKLYLKPCRLKIFKNSNSLSYRRLLPYLKQIYGDSTRTSNEDQLKKDGASVKAGDFIISNHFIGTSVGGTTGHGDSSPIIAAPCVLKPEPTNFEQSSELDALTDSLTELQSEDASKSTINLQILSHGNGLPMQLPSSSSRPNSLYLGESVEKSQYITSRFKEDGMPENVQHSDDVIHLNNDLIHHEPKTLPGRPFVCPTRGILKRNPRGCRGLCTCIKCASFRLHAEKAFEFSRNQLLDSEEIALELIDELSLLRKLLEKSTDADNGSASVETSQIQVREACRKANQIEQQTKARFQQMNHDLNTHCQIPNLQRPTVSFVKRF
uniref:Uncharacterized protein n=2 Tax=Kalanchoe fedtschenkoi TaxID=63787 RepID=A0A7N0ZW77_KALFE